MKQFIVNNLRVVSRWFLDDKDLEFKTSGSRLTKSQRRRANDALATLKGFGWLKPRNVSVETVKPFTLDLNQIERFIMEQHYELIDRYGVEDAVILMGRDHFYALAKTTICSPMCIPLSDFQCGQQNRFAGMYLVVLPWMEGTVLVPKQMMPIDRELVPSGIMVTAETQRKLEDEAEVRLAAALWNQFMGRIDDE